MASPPAGPAEAGGRVALVVEDEFLVGRYLERLLERHGWRVLGPAATVAEALRLLEREAAPPAVALLDVTLGGESVAPVAEGAAGVGRAVRAGQRLRHRGPRGASPGRGVQSRQAPTSDACSRPWCKPWQPDGASASRFPILGQNGQLLAIGDGDDLAHPGASEEGGMPMPAHAW
jgi:hypothetical protein